MSANYVSSFEVCGEGSNEDKQQKKKKKEKNSFSAYEELRVYKRHNITKALIESLMLRRGNKTLGGSGSGCELN